MVAAGSNIRNLIDRSKHSGKERINADMHRIVFADLRPHMVRGIEQIRAHTNILDLHFPFQLLRRSMAGAFSIMNAGPVRVRKRKEELAILVAVRAAMREHRFTVRDILGE
jgi:hypothetical protein